MVQGYLLTSPLEMIRAQPRKTYQRKIFERIVEGYNNENPGVSIKFFTKVYPGGRFNMQYLLYEDPKGYDNGLISGIHPIMIINKISPYID